MAKNKLEDLRNHLFAALEGLSPDADKPMELDRAKAIADVARVIVETAKVEVQFIQALDGRTTGTGFVPVDVIEGAPQRPRLAAGGR